MYTTNKLTSHQILELIYDGDNENENHDNKCIICMENIQPIDNKKLKCGHYFHYDCILESYKMFTSKKKRMSIL